MEECMKVAREFPDVEVDDVIVDAMMAHVVRNPQRFDVIVTTNMYGDILSDLPRNCRAAWAWRHRSTPARIMAWRRRRTVPRRISAARTSPIRSRLILSAAMLLAWHGRRAKNDEFEKAADAIERAVESAIAAKQTTRDIDGALGTRAAGEAVARASAGLKPCAATVTSTSSGRRSAIRSSKNRTYTAGLATSSSSNARPRRATCAASSSCSRAFTARQQPAAGRSCRAAGARPRRGGGRAGYALNSRADENERARCARAADQFIQPARANAPLQTRFNALQSTAREWTGTSR